MQQMFGSFGKSCTLGVASDGKVLQVLGGDPALLGLHKLAEVIGINLLDIASEEDRLPLQEFLGHSGYSVNSMIFKIPINASYHQCVRMRLLKGFSASATEVHDGLVGVEVSEMVSQSAVDRAALLHQRFFDVSQNPAVLLDSNHRILEVNQAFTKTWRFPSRNRLRGGLFHEYWNSPSRLIEALSIAEREGAWDGPLTALRSDSTLFNVHATISRADDPRSEPYCLVVSIKPECTHDAEQLSHRLIDTESINYFEFSPDAIFLINREGVIRGVNRAAGLLHGQKPADMVGRNIRDYDDEVAREQVEARLAKCLAGESMRFEVNHIRSDGAIIPLEVIAMPIDYEGEPHVLAIDRDISDRIAAQNLLRENEERLRLALSSTKQGTYDLNVQTGECIVSDEYARMLGYDPATFVETHANWLQRLHADDRVGCETNYNDYVDGKLDEYRVEFRQRTRDGAWKWLLSVGQIIAHDNQGDPLRMIGTHTDITRMKQVQTELDEQRAQLARLGRVSMSNSLAAAVAHELNQPMCAIANYTASAINTIQNEPLDVGTLKNDLVEINHTVHRAAGITKRFKKLMSSKTINSEAVHMTGLIDSSLNLISNELRSDGVRVKRKFEPGLPDVLVDKTLIQHVICNLLMNACEAMRDQPNDQRLITVSLLQSLEEDSIECRFSDTGPGIDEARRDDLFDACVSGKPEGLGLGLTISKMIVSAHQGDLRLISTGREGTVISFTVPLRCQEQADHPSDPKTMRQASFHSSN